MSTSGEDLGSILAGSWIRPTCWGKEEDYPETSDFAAGECHVYYDGAERKSHSVDPEIMGRVMSAGYNMPSMRHLVATKFGDAHHRGMYFYYEPPNLSNTRAAVFIWSSPDVSGCGRADLKSSFSMALKPLISTYERLLSLLYDTKRGVLTLEELRVQYSEITGSPIDEAITMEDVDTSIKEVESALRLSSDETAVCTRIVRM